MSNKLDEFLDGFKLGEILHKNEIETQKNKNCMLKCCIMTLSIILVIAAITFAVYKIVSSKMDDCDDFDDDFDDDFLFDDDEEDEDISEDSSTDGDDAE